MSAHEFYFPCGLCRSLPQMHFHQIQYMLVELNNFIQDLVLKYTINYLD